MSCPACGSREFRGAVTIFDHEYALARRTVYEACRSCATRFQVPMPDESELSSFYPDDYHSRAPESRLADLRHRVRWRSLSRRLEGPGALLDFGCGDGAFLRFAAARAGGRPLWGFELADAPALERHGNLTIVRGTLETVLRMLPPCRLITMNHVVEHLPRPVETLRHLGSILVPGGWLVGQTPAAGSLEHRVFGAFWSGFHAPRHTVIFSGSGLRQVLERAGFTDVRIHGTVNPAAAAVSVGSLLGGNRPGHIRRAGWRWLVLLGLGAAFAPLDVLSGRPGIVDFEGRRDVA